MLCVWPWYTAQYLYPAFTLRPSSATLWVSNISSMGIFSEGVKHLFLVPWAQTFGRALCLAPVSPYFQSTHPDSIEIFLKTQTCYPLFRKEVSLHLAHASKAFAPVSRALLAPLSKSLHSCLASTVPSAQKVISPTLASWNPTYSSKSTCVPTAAQWMGSTPGSRVHLLCDHGQGTRLPWASVCCSSNRGLNQRMPKRQENKIPRNNF